MQLMAGLAAQAAGQQCPLYLMCIGLLECTLVGVDAAVWKLDRRLWPPWAEDSGEALQQAASYNCSAEV